MEQNNQKFPGFPPEPATNYWPYPKALNGYWHILNGSEQKVLDYILRHTWGYNKTFDRISLSQFKHGIITKNGKRIDAGIGVKKDETILNAIKKLEKIGFIEVNQVNGKTKFIKLRLLTKIEDTPYQNGEVATHQKGDTINNVTINNKQYNSSKKKPYFWGMPMWKDKNGKWWVIHGRDDFREFAGKESEIEWKRKGT